MRQRVGAAFLGKRLRPAMHAVRVKAQTNCQIGGPWGSGLSTGTWERQRGKLRVTSHSHHVFHLKPLLRPLAAGDPIHSPWGSIQSPSHGNTPGWTP